jgi:putative ABC transport system substrate-binding protein
MPALSAPHVLAKDKLWLIGWLSLQPPTSTVDIAAFRQGLAELGYNEGRDYVIDEKYADTDASRLPALARELVDRGVDVIVTIGTPPVAAARAATTTIPVVMAGGNYPVELGLVASLAHPGGNVTGVTISTDPAFSGKGLELLKEAVPSISRVAILWDSSNTPERLSLDAQQAVASNLRLKLLLHDENGLNSARELDAILSEIIEERADSVFVHPGFINSKYKKQIIDFTLTNRLPSLGQFGRYAEDGGLLYYYADWLALRRRAATYVDKIFKGAKPADLPVEQPTKFELVINLKTAQVLGLTVPHSLLQRADEVIE